LYHVPDLILASTSPRRRELLAQAGFQFTVRARPVEEIHQPGEHPKAYVMRLARAKAEAAFEHPQEIVLGADTTVVLDHRLLEKPHTPAAAKAMLRALSCREHTVHTGICLLYRHQAIVDCETTQVSFVELDEKEIEDYVSTGDPMDKAGAYGIQGLASKFVDRIEGDFFNNNPPTEPRPSGAVSAEFAAPAPYQTSTLATLPSNNFTRPIEASFS
jgi:septum formation protein